MAKIVDFGQFCINFDNFYSDSVRKQFYNSDIGRLYQDIPWDILVRFYRQREQRTKKVKGRPRKLSIRAGLAILFLQAYTGLSARKLLEQITQNIFYQYFIGTKFVSELNKNDHFLIYRLKDYYTLSLDEIHQLQKQFARKWKKLLPDTYGIMMDATVFESNITWPVMIRLMDNVLSLLIQYRQDFSQRLGSSISNRSYEKLHLEFKKLIIKRKRNYKQHISLIRKQTKLAIRYLRKLQSQILILESRGEPVSDKQKASLNLIAQVLKQQEKSLSGQTVSHLIVSLYKAYIHAIYRGKPRQPREYGLKFHLFLQGGLLWIDYYSNENFNETVRLPRTVNYSWELFGHKPMYLAADRIYQTRSNRNFLKEHGIKSNFPPVGRVKESEKELRKQLIRALNRGRNQIEGVFGVLKNHFYTQRIRYKSKQSNVLMVFLSITAYNSLKVNSYRRASSSPPSSARVA